MPSARVGDPLVFSWRNLILAFGLAALSRMEANAVETVLTEAALAARTQELVDAIAVGNRAPWIKYYADDCLYCDEKGSTMDKAALVESITPLPSGFSGSIKVEKPRSRIDGDVAIFSYDLDESETVFGQVMHARYHGTDTWRFRNGVWQIAAGQMLRYYEDPPVGTAKPASLGDFAGTYELTVGKQLRVVAEQGVLYLERPGNPRETLLVESGDVFFRKGVEGRIVFRRNAAGAVDAYISRRNNEDIVWVRTK